MIYLIYFEKKEWNFQCLFNNFGSFPAAVFNFPFLLWLYVSYRFWDWRRFFEQCDSCHLTWVMFYLGDALLSCDCWHHLLESDIFFFSDKPLVHYSSTAKSGESDRDARRCTPRFPFQHFDRLSLVSRALSFIGEFLVTSGAPVVVRLLMVFVVMVERYHAGT